MCETCANSPIYFPLARRKFVLVFDGTRWCSRRGWDLRHVSESGESSSSGVSCSSGGSPPGSHVGRDVGLGLGLGLWQGTKRNTW